MGERQSLQARAARGGEADRRCDRTRHAKLKLGRSNDWIDGRARLIPSALPESSAGMMALMQLLQSFARHMRIDGRRRNIRVAEQQLDDAQIGAVIQKVRRECV